MANAIKIKRFLPALVSLSFFMIYLNGNKFDLPVIMFLGLNFLGFEGIEGFGYYLIYALASIYLLFLPLSNNSKRKTYINIICSIILSLFTFLFSKEIFFEFRFTKMLILVSFYTSNTFFLITNCKNFSMISK